MSVFKQLIEIEEEANNFGFQWPNVHLILEQIKSECDEIEQAFNHGHPSHDLQEEVGDLLHSVFSLCLFLNFDPEQTLALAIGKFAKRFMLVKEIAKKQGYMTLQGEDITVLMTLWREAKQSVKLENDNAT